MIKRHFGALTFHFVIENTRISKGLQLFLSNRLSKKALLHVGNLSNIRSAFTTTVYAFLNPKLPSAAWDFFCLRFGVWHLSRRQLQARPRFFVYY